MLSQYSGAKFIAPHRIGIDAEIHPRGAEIIDQDSGVPAECRSDYHGALTPGPAPIVSPPRPLNIPSRRGAGVVERG